MKKTHFLAIVIPLAIAGCQTTGPRMSSSTDTSSTTKQDQIALWNDARQRGMAFRAEGHSPDWVIEVEKKHHPTLYINLDDGKRNFKVRHTQTFGNPESGTIGFKGRANSAPVTLTIQLGECERNMRNNMRQSAAELNVGTQTYTGCGKFLFK